VNATLGDAGVTLVDANQSASNDKCTDMQIENILHCNVSLRRLAAEPESDIASIR
jgi:hypothetical protein